MSHRELQLRGDIRQAFENFMGERVCGPWDILIEELATIVEQGALPAGTAARIDVALQRTQGGQLPDTCPACACPAPGSYH